MKIAFILPVWLRKWCKRLAVLRYRGKRRRGVKTAAEVLRQFQRTPAERDKYAKDLQTMDPGRHEPGYDERSGATIYPDSEVLTPYIGSAQEAEDAAKQVDPRKSRKKQFGKYTCTTCHGWGCARCGGKGWN